MAIFFFVRSAAVAVERGAEAFAAFADPANLAGGYASHQGVGFHVFGHHGAGGDEGALAHGMAADHGAVGAQRGAFADLGLGVDAMHGEVGTRRGHVGEHAAWAAEHIVLDLDAFVDGDVVLHADIVTDMHIVAHVDVLSEGAVLADDGTFLDVAEMPYLGAFANAYVFIDVTAFVYVKIIHSI